MLLEASKLHTITEIKLKTIDVKLAMINAVATCKTFLLALLVFFFLLMVKRDYTSFGIVILNLSGYEMQDPNFVEP